MASKGSSSKPTGTNSASKDAGFRNFKHFLESYGLRLTSPDDVEEGKAILRAMGYSV
ncbi:hypothetical protein BU26DRAFT_170528 [Trematosphaeria pertusa]|uniref:Uncharacterized protein n=1 Tax=Trematosphaeria pertusa TaxID=390896 RepID=A0A6A6HW65_9PLEO|nr:uncharacterized protein BU26DRAFT_170528 [Trematosphaeria pertusa]KAF2241803.1 hypothetical protein BU26DRAFT_170528 [Trematosphaeria pertusa]